MPARTAPFSPPPGSSTRSTDPASSVRSGASAVTTTTRTTPGVATAAAIVSSAIARTSRSRADADSTPASRVFPSAAGFTGTTTTHRIGASSPTRERMPS